MATKATTTAVETTLADVDETATIENEADIEVVEEPSLTTADLINLAILSAKNQPLETQIVSRLNEAKQFLI